MATRKPTDVEYRFKIDAYSPETMPMARLAEYMAELATMLGEQKAVHFRRLEKGSTVLVHKVEVEAAPKVRARVDAVRRQQGSVEALRAYKTMNRMLQQDNGKGALKEKGAVVIRFPGIDDTREKYPPVREYGSIDGVIVSVGGTADAVWVKLAVEGGALSGIYTTDRHIGKELAGLFDEPVRLNGWGNWNRDDDGGWNLMNFKIESFEPLKAASLSEALAELRALPFRFDEGAYEELETLRHGPLTNNGSH